MSFFSAKNTDTPNPFRPALRYLISSGRPHTPRPLLTRQNSDDSIDSDIERHDTKMSSYSQTELHPTSIPLTTISRSPSPYARSRRNSNSNQDSDTDDFDLRPSLLAGGPVIGGWRAFAQYGGPGQWLFTTPWGWQSYVLFLSLWCMGCSLGLFQLNRLTFSTGVYKFPYPMTVVFMELCSTYLLLWAAAGLTRLFSRYLTAVGLVGMVSPSSSSSHLGGDRTRSRASCISGIAGGGLFEFEFKVAREVFPTTLVFVLKVLFSTFCLSYTQYSMYVQCRIAIVPLTLLFSTFLNRTSLSVPVLSAALTATFTLMAATHQANLRVAWDVVAAGIASSICVALYPVMLKNVYTVQVAAITPEPEFLSSRQSEISSDMSGSREEARASWRVMHYVSLMSILLFLPIFLYSGEVGDISRNSYILDKKLHWFYIACQGVGAWSVFFGTFVLVRATSPVTTNFLFIPRVAFLYPILSKFKLPAYSWIGVVMCWASVTWYMQAQRKQGLILERLGRSRT